ncbi:MAG TPA: hypothetical protein VFH03_12520 [Actinoplanes sp.]|nr:hypothetical protein [Actinoplanes sp.]
MIGRRRRRTNAKHALAAAATVLVISGCAAGHQTTSARPVSPAAGSNLQDMLDLYALKRQLNALRRERPPVSSDGGSVRVICGVWRGHHLDR